MTLNFHHNGDITRGDQGVGFLDSEGDLQLEDGVQRQVVLDELRGAFEDREGTSWPEADDWATWLPILHEEVYGPLARKLAAEHWSEAELGIVAHGPGLVVADTQCMWAADGAECVEALSDCEGDFQAFCDGHHSLGSDKETRARYLLIVKAWRGQWSTEGGWMEPVEWAQEQMGVA